MKARMPKWDKKVPKAINECFAEEIQKAKDEATQIAVARCIIFSCGALHTQMRDNFGQKRLAEYLSGLQEFCEFLGGYDDAAVYKALQILEDDCPGIDWKKQLGIKFVEV